MADIFRCLAAFLLMAALGSLVKAQPPGSAELVSSPQVSYPLLSDTELANERRIQEALAKPITCDWKAVPLKEVVRQLADECDITIVLTKKIEDAGVTADQPVTRKLSKVPLRSALRLVLGDLNLKYLSTDNVLKITTIDSECPLDSQEIRVYPVHDLVELAKPATDAKTALDFAPLISLIHEIEPDSWQDVGGPGSVKGFDNAGCLFIAQRDDVHERIGVLLTTLRRVKTVQGLKSRASATVPNRYLSPAK